MLKTFVLSLSKPAFSSQLRFLPARKSANSAADTIAFIKLASLSILAKMI